MGFFLIILGFLGVLQSAYGEEPSALQWLRDMRHAAEVSSYEGTIIYSKGNKLDSFRVFHGMYSGVERERMISTNSPLREVVRNNQRVTCYFPDNKTVAIEQKSNKRSILFDIPGNVDEVSKQYEVAFGGEGIIAQRQVKLISITPKDDFRFKRLFWLDKETKLPLKFELLGEDGSPVEQVLYTDLNYKTEVPSASFEPSTHSDESWQVKEHQTLPAETLKWSLSDVPEGFHLVSYSRLRRAEGVHAIDHILLSDGFASVSVYVDHSDEKAVAPNFRNIGGLNSITRQVDDYLVTVMGEVPEKAVAVIANGLRRQAQ